MRRGKNHPGDVGPVGEMQNRDGWPTGRLSNFTNALLLLKLLALRDYGLGPRPGFMLPMQLWEEGVIIIVTYLLINSLIYGRIMQAAIIAHQQRASLPAHISLNTANFIETIKLTTSIIERAAGISFDKQKKTPMAYYHAKSCKTGTLIRGIAIRVAASLLIISSVQQLQATQLKKLRRSGLKNPKKRDR